jgi:hypothetical protein
MIGIAGLGLIWFDKRAKKMRLWISGFAIASTLTTVPGFYFREHYFLLMLPAMALLAGCAVSGTNQLWKPRADVSRIKDWPLWGYALLQMTIILVHSDVWFFMTPAQASIAKWNMSLFVDAEIAAAYIHDHSTSGARVAVIGSEPEIYFLSNRHSATGYIYTYSLMEPQPFAKRMQEEMISEIENVSPEFVTYIKVDNSWIQRPKSDTYIFHWWYSYQTNYTLIGFLDATSTVENRAMWGMQARHYANNIGLLVYQRKMSPLSSGGPLQNH